MASLRASFEKELKQKLGQKATQFQSEETVLLKAFKYFDLTQGGQVNKQQFLKVIEKLGLPVFNSEDFFELFEYYNTDNDGQLKYKEFIGQLYSNTTASTRQKSPVKNYSKTTTQYYKGYTSQDAVLKLQKLLHQKGVSTIFGLAVAFLSVDEQKTRQVSFDNFSNILQQFGLIYNGEDIKDIFEYFDKQKIGYISYDEFLLGVRGPLSAFRKAQIRAAFQTIDYQQKAVVPLEAIKTNYNARLHPDVRIGKKTESEIIREFLKNLENYSVFQNIQDGYITQQEFEQFFAFYSCCIENDTYFELLMKSTFQSSQQQIQDQQQQYQQQQTQDNLQNISNKSDISPESIQDPRQIESVTRLDQQQDIPDNQSQRSHVSQRSQRSQVSQARSQPSQPRSQVSQARSQTSQQQQDSNRIFELLYTIRQKLLSRGARGFIGIQRQFRIMDDDYDMKITLNEFKRALKDYKISLTDEEFLEVFQALDLDGSGKLDIDEVVRGIRGPMNEYRQSLVKQAFSKLDADGDNIITVNDIKGVYSARYHPDVRKGQRSEDEVLGEFLETFELHHNLKRGLRDQRVTLEEFLEYYNNVSANIDDDDYFTLMINNAYRMNSQNQHYQAFQQGSQPASARQQLMDDYRSQITRNAPFGTSQSQLDYSTSLRPQTQNKPRQQGELGNVPAGVPSWPGFSWRPQTSSTDKEQFQVSAEELIVNLRQKLRARGARGILSLGKFFRLADRNNSGQLDYQEFQNVINNLRLNQTEEQNQKLFSFFDRDQSGQISYDEFLRHIRGNMNSFRKDLVNQAFKKFDKDGSGQVDINDLKGVYDASQHPDVKNGKKTEEEILGEFLDTFELHHALQAGTNDDRNKVVTWEEFIEYYENISASVDDDRYFELLITTAWRLNASGYVQKKAYRAQF